MTLAYATSETLIDATLDFAIGPDVRSQNSAGVRGRFPHTASHDVVHFESYHGWATKPVCVHNAK